MRKRSFLPAILCLLIAAGQAMAQQIGQTTPDPKLQPGISPTGQGLSNLYSPNLFDGCANVSIPIYPYEAGGISCGISLSYNTKGIRVDQVAGSCGLNWNLNVSGSIVRSIKDLPDEINVAAGDTVELFTNPFSPSSLYLPNTYTKFRGRYVTYSENGTDSANAKIYRDRETDEFMVNAGGLSFSFHMGQNGTFFTMPEYNAKIEVLIDDSAVSNITSREIGRYETSGLLGFKITDVEGNQYFFARGDYEKKNITDEYEGKETISSYYATTKWDIKKIVLAAGGVITYTYKTVGSAMILPVYVQNNLYEGAYVPAYQSAEIKAEVSPSFSYFSEITSVAYPNNTRADFIYDSTARCDYPTGALRQIKVSGGSNCLRYIMDQSYFIALTGSADSAEYTYGHCYTSPISSPDPNFSMRYQRLRLNAIRIMSCDSSTIEPYYSFNYDTTRLPPRMDGRQDFFGYYNGFGTAGQGTIPSHNRWATGTAYSGRDRAANPAYLRASLLTKISNSYGGSITFYHGAHKISGGTSSLSNVMSGLPSDPYFMGTSADDGLRVDSTVEADIYHPGNTKVTKYTYEGGQRFLTGGYFYFPDIMKDGTDSVTQIVMGGAYVSPHQMVNGGNHGYSQVTTTIETGGQLLSKKVIRFTNFSDSTSGNVPRYYTTGSGKDYYTFPYTDKQYIRSWEMGLPISITDYDLNNRIVMQTLNYYSFKTDTAAIQNTKVAKVKRKDVNYPGMTGMYLLKRDITDNYRPYRGTALLDSVITRNYVSDTRYVPDTVRYTYDSRHHLKTMLHRNSEGYVDKTINVYNYDLGGGSGAVATMNTNGLEKVLSVQRWHAGSTLAADKLMDVTISGLDYQGTLRPKNTYVLDYGNPVGYSQYVSNPSDPYRNIDTAFAGNGVSYLKKALDVTLYDSKGNPQETHIMGVNSYKAMIWDTATGQKLAEAANCRYSDMGYTSFETGSLAHSNFSYNPLTAVFASDGVSGSRCFRLNDLLGGNTNLQGTQDLQSGKPYILSFWSKGPAPAVSIGVTSLTLPAAAKTVNGWSNYIVRFTPSATGKVKISGAGSNTYLDEVRLHPAAAAMQSNTYVPLFGTGSTTAANGRISYVTYDKMGRQTVVRDQEGNILSKTEYVVQGSE